MLENRSNILLLCSADLQTAAILNIDNCKVHDDSCYFSISNSVKMYMGHSVYIQKMTQDACLTFLRLVLYCKFTLNPEIPT